MKMLCFKFQQNHTISEEFGFFDWGGGVGRGTPFISLISIIIGKHMKMLCFKFPQNRPINE